MTIDPPAATEGSELTVTEAAKAAGVDRRTIRRRLDGGDFPHAHREAGKFGPDTGPWLIPVEDLIGAGLRLHQPAAPDEPTSDSANRAETEAALRLALADVVRRAEVAEATAAERERVIQAQELAIRALMNGVDHVDATERAPSGRARAAPPLRWWQRW